MRILIAGAAASLLAGAASAQTPQTAPTQVNPPNAAAPPAADATAQASPYRQGAQVKDGQGQVVGTIARVIKTPDGATTVSVTVDGRNVNMPASNLTPSADGGAVSAMTKAQISESVRPPT